MGVFNKKLRSKKFCCMKDIETYLGPATILMNDKFLPEASLGPMMPFNIVPQSLTHFKAQLPKLDLQQNLVSWTTPLSRFKDWTVGHDHDTIGKLCHGKVRIKNRERKNRAKKRAFASLRHSLQPKGPGCNDRTIFDRGLNILTSLPILSLGLSIRQKDKRSKHLKQYGSSIMCVGLAATAYHSTTGKLRSLLRKADYYTISFSSVKLTQAIHTRHRESLSGRAAILLSLLAVPFKPSFVTAFHSAAAEVEYLKQARWNQTLQKHHISHCASLASGLTLFALEDTALKHNIHVTHSIWHCLAAKSTSSFTPLIQLKEKLSRKL